MGLSLPKSNLFFKKKCLDKWVHFSSCRKIIEDGNKAPDPKKYKSAHRAEYKLHDTLKQQLQDLGITKLPAPERLENKIASLKKDYSRVQKEKQELEKQQSTLNIVSENIEHLLSNNTPYKNEIQKTEHDL